MTQTADLLTDWQDIDLPDAQLRYWPQFVDRATADRWFEALRDTLAWHQEEIIMFGRPTPVPRLVAWYGEPEARYRYSGVMHEPLAWTDALAQIRDRVRAAAGMPFNSVLANYYRDGADSMGWHRDSEDGLGRNPVIASVSLGGVRTFRLRHRRSRQVHSLDLVPGSLLVMGGPMQHHWYHAVPKTRKPVAPRINLTFRTILRPDR